MHKIIFLLNNAILSFIFLIGAIFLIGLSAFPSLSYSYSRILYDMGIGFLVAGLSTITYQYLMYNKILEYLGEFKNIFSQGISIYPNHHHGDIPKQSNIIERQAKKIVKVFTTTGGSYFSDDTTFQIIKDKAKKGCKFRFLLLDPESEALRDRSRQERDAIDYDTMKDKIKMSIKRFIKAKDEVGEKIQVKLYDCASAYQSFIIDEEVMYIAPRIYGIKTTEDTPCIKISGRYPDNSVFQKYLKSFDEIWDFNSYHPLEEFQGLEPKSLLYLETWLTLNMTVGCDNKCGYCFLKSFDWGGNAHRISTPDASLNALLKYRYFIPNRTILCIGARTEPFLKPLPIVKTKNRLL